MEDDLEAFKSFRKHLSLGVGMRPQGFGPQSQGVMAPDLVGHVVLLFALRRSRHRGARLSSRSRSVRGSTTMLLPTRPA